jgi:glycosyltransferase involved in cell wall biosynthesis
MEGGYRLLPVNFPTAMNVLLIHNYYRQYGGEDAAFDADRRLLEERGMAVRQYSRHNDETGNYSLIQKAAFPLKTISSPETAPSVEAVLREFPADVAYLHNLYPLISPSIYEVLHRNSIPIVQVLHDYRPFCPNGWLYTGGEICDRCSGGRYWNAVVHKCLQQSRAVSAVYAATLWNLRRSRALDHVAAFICPSEFSRQLAIRNGLDSAKIFVRPHHIDVTSYAPPAGSDDYFLFLGRLSPEKGLRTLLRAFDGLSGVRLSIAGSGPIEGELSSWLASRGMTHVRMVGFQSGAAKTELIRNARAMIVPSEAFETFGITVLEAYAAGRPVIASNAGSLPGLVEDGITGLLFERKNSDALRYRVMELHHDPATARRMGHEGWLRIAQKYSTETAFGQLMDIFEFAQSKPAPSRLHSQVGAA